MNEKDWKSRTRLLISENKLQILQNSHVLVAGLGGVGGFTAEQLCRAGIGNLTIVDNDIVNPSNRNRQIIALTSTEGVKKTKLIADRLKDINPDVRLNTYDVFMTEENMPGLLEENYDYVADAIDTLTPKVALLSEAVNRGYKVVSSMGSGGKMDPSLVRVEDISKSHHCKFAYLVRKYLHKKGIREGIQVVYSPESVSRNTIVETDGKGYKRSVIGTISYMPAVFGCFMASEIIHGLFVKASSAEY
jgi:tRNA A37 threonylcarbamoyladenosine dehydratase